MSPRTTSHAPVFLARDSQTQRNGAGDLVTQTDATQSNLSGYARGVEIMLQRQSANGFSGWLAVGRSQIRYTSDTRLEFAGDHDQRTSITAYGSYRWSNDLGHVTPNAGLGSGD